MELEEWRFSDTFRAGLNWRDPKVLTVKFGLAGIGRGTSLRELGVGLKRASLGDQCSVSSAGGTQKTWKAVVQKESADTQEYESCQLNDVGRGRRRGQGGVELRSQCGEQFRLGGVNPREEGFNHFDVAAVMVDEASCTR